VGQRSEISNFCSDLKGDLEWKDSPIIKSKKEKQKESEEKQKRE
jgi:hypothetical protein